MNITIIVTGSIAAYKAAELTSRLIKDGHAIQIVMTEGALKFVGVTTFETLSNQPVYTDLWAARERTAHIALRRWTDLYICYPATANRINQFAAGLAPDLVGAVYLANNAEKPFWIAPAMNTYMLNHPATQAALKTLSGWGCRIIPGEDGRLACGDFGSGRLAEPSVVLALVRAEVRRLNRLKLYGSDEQSPRLLVTGGAMSERIDAVRTLENTSSGRTASSIARAFLDAGWQVDYLHHMKAELEGSEGANLHSYTSFDDLSKAIKNQLSTNNYTAIIHAAAVADFKVADVEAAARTKVDSGDKLVLELVKTPKLIATLRSESKGKPVIVAFKLTVGQDEKTALAIAQRFLDKNYADVVVHNDIADVNAKTHEFSLLQTGTAKVIHGKTNTELAGLLLETISKKQSLSGFKEETDV